MSKPQFSKPNLDGPASERPPESKAPEMTDVQDGLGAEHEAPQEDDIEQKIISFVCKKSIVCLKPTSALMKRIPTILSDRSCRYRNRCSYYKKRVRRFCAARRNSTATAGR